MSGPLESLELWLSGPGRGLTEGSAPVILMAHAAVHQNIAYSVNGLITGVADGGQINMAFWNPSGSIGKEAHTSIVMAAGGQAFGFLYEGGSISSTGTFIEPVPLNRVLAGDKPPQWRGGSQVVVNTLGTLLRDRFLGGSTGANPNAGRFAGREESGYEWILSPDQLYILVILNTSGAIVPVQIMLEYYEED